MSKINTIAKAGFAFPHRQFSYRAAGVADRRRGRRAAALLDLQLEQMAVEQPAMLLFQQHGGAVAGEADDVAASGAGLTS